MGDTACLMQPFCYASGISNESNETNPTHVLGQSISFGRFRPESLAWEKWSSFSHNRYVEEAERYSRPGSVAQKKAFFEAHYKKLAAQKAAALLEQANNAASNNVTEQEHEAVVHNTHDSQKTSPSSKLVGNDEQDVNLLTSENNKVEGADQETQYQASAENSTKVELQNHLDDVDTNKDASEKVTGTPPMGTPILKSSNSDQEVSASMSKKKAPVSSFKLAKATGTSKFTSTPAESRAPISSNKDNIATPMINKPALCSADRKRSTPKSLHKSVNFTPIRELNRLTASVMRKFESARVGAASSKASKDSSTPLTTPTTASKNGLQKYPSMTPFTEKKRTKTPIPSSASGSNTAGPKWRFLSTENKMRSPMLSSPFSLRTEERAARRKKKLEEKFNANEAQKVQLHTKLKEKAETEIRKLRQSFCFKARPLPDFYKERKVSMNETRKCPLTHPQSPRQGRKPIPSVGGSKTSVTPQRPSVKNSGTKKNFPGKNGWTPTHPLTSNSTMITHENTSPNIQHRHQNDRNCGKLTQSAEHH